MGSKARLRFSSLFFPKSSSLNDGWRLFAGCASRPGWKKIMSLSASSPSSACAAALLRGGGSEKDTEGEDEDEDEDDVSPADDDADDDDTDGGLGGGRVGLLGLAVDVLTLARRGGAAGGALVGRGGRISSAMVLARLKIVDRPDDVFISSSLEDFTPLQV